MKDIIPTTDKINIDYLLDNIKFLNLVITLWVYEIILEYIKPYQLVDFKFVQLTVR